MDSIEKSRYFVEPKKQTPMTVAYNPLLPFFWAQSGWFLYGEDHSWLAPYAYIIVIIGFLLLFFRGFEHYYSVNFDRPLVRHYFVFRKLNREQKAVLQSRFAFYNQLSKRHRRQFRHRVATFLKDKRFFGRDGFELREEHRVLIAASGCMLSFGRKNYTYGLLDSILVYGEPFYSQANEAYHKGEFNPQHRVLALSWPDFEHGYQIDNDNLNLGLHEFMHAMHLEVKTSKDPDSARYNKQFQNILKQLMQAETKEQLEQTQFFRAYAFTNQYEFMAVLTEYFFESPRDFKQLFPELYTHVKNMLNFRFAGWDERTR